MNNKQTKKCDCLIGFLCGDKVTRSTFIDDINRLVDNQMQSVRKGNHLDKKQIIDTRRGYLSKFSYCPRCGSKINWEEITNELSEE